MVQDSAECACCLNTIATAQPARRASAKQICMYTSGEEYGTAETSRTLQELYDDPGAA